MSEHVYKKLELVGSSKDSIEGTNAWFDKREPKFEGR